MRKGRLASDFVIALLLPSLGRSKVGGQARAGPGRAPRLLLTCWHLAVPPPPRLATCPPPLACKTWLLARYPSIQSKSHVSLSLSGVSEHAFWMFCLLLSVATKFP